MIPPFPNSSTYVDWRSWDIVNPIQYQGNCGSCWAFAAVAVAESYFAILTGGLHKLSE
jgi:C1A family cysteine protease